MSDTRRTGNFGKVEKIGYFRFVENFKKPIQALVEAVDKEQEQHSYVNNSLIVLPEAFNIGGPYPCKQMDSELPAHEILEELRETAARLGIAFVAGILDGRKNSAFRIDANGPQLVCHKLGEDLTGAYDPCLQNPDWRNPITCANARVAALICMDATEDKTDIKQRRSNLLTNLKEGEGHKIICVPARFTHTSPDPLAFRSIVPDYWYVVADGNYLNSSFVARAQKSTNFLEAKLVDSPAPAGNQVRLWPLS